VNAKIRQQIERRKRRIARRLDKNDNRGCDRPIMTASNIHYEIADRTRATANGGIGAMHLLVRKLELDQAIDRHLGLLKIHLPYHDSDHVLNIAYNLLAGGRCLEHLELLRSDEGYLDALGARRIPDPTTAGDFCRRFDAAGNQSHDSCSAAGRTRRRASRHDRAIPLGPRRLGHAAPLSPGVSAGHRRLCSVPWEGTSADAIRVMIGVR